MTWMSCTTRQCFLIRKTTLVSVQPWRWRRDGFVRIIIMALIFPLALLAYHQLIPSHPQAVQSPSCRALTFENMLMNLLAALLMISMTVRDNDERDSKIATDSLL